MKPHSTIKVPMGKNVNTVVQATHTDDAYHMGKCTKCNKRNHFREVCRRARGSMVQNIMHEAEQEQENQTKMMNINSFNFIANCSIITTNLNKSPNKVVITVSYKVDTCSDGSKMPLYTYTKNIS